MKIVTDPAEAVNTGTLPPRSVVYMAGNAGTPQRLIDQIVDDDTIRHIAIYVVLPLGDAAVRLYSESVCKRVTHRVIFNSYATREAVNQGWAKYHPMHLSEIPRYIREGNGIDVALLSVAGPDAGGNYSLGTTVEGVRAAIRSARAKGGKVIAERNQQMPFVLGTTVPESEIDILLETDYALPTSPVRPPDSTARRIGDMIAGMFISDGGSGSPGSTLQYGIGEVPEAVTDAILARGYRNLGIHTELFAGAMRRLAEAGAVTNFWRKNMSFSTSAIFLAEDQAGYRWFDFNSSIQSRGCDYTNSVYTIAEQPRMVAINSAIGVDLSGNVWADSLDARKIYSGVGGQADFIRGAQYSDGGLAIIALRSRTRDGRPKIVDRCPAGITTTAIPADQVVIVTEHGVFDPRRLSQGEKAVGIAHLAHPDDRDELLRIVHDDPAFHNVDLTLYKGVPGFTPYERAGERG